MSIVVRKENGQFNMYQNGSLIHENLKVIVDKRKGNGIDDGDIRLPENSLGKKWLSTTKFVDGVNEIDLANIPGRISNTEGVVRSNRESWTDYLTEEEKTIYDGLKKSCEERMNKSKTENQFKELAKKFSKEELMALLGMVNEEVEA